MSFSKWYNINKYYKEKVQYPIQMISLLQFIKFMKIHMDTSKLRIIFSYL